METFEIAVNGEALTIKPMGDESFQVYQEGELLATLTPNIDDAWVRWTSADLIAPEYAQAIGEAIEAYDR